jgi:aryl-alcohol dehydrogenase-like predicted oxidoreductase
VRLPHRRARATRVDEVENEGSRVDVPEHEREGLPKRRLGPLDVACIGLGSVPISGYYGACDDQAALEVLQRALEVGVTLIDTGDNYARGATERLIGRAITGQRESVVLSTKGGLVIHDLSTFDLRPNGTPEHLRASFDESLGRLGVDHVDLYFLHRVDPDVPVEESVGAMGEFVAAGKAGAIGLCEVDVETLERANAVHPISCVQAELSLWAREPLDGVVGWCADHGAGFIAYSSLGRGFLTGAVTADTHFPEGDFRRGNPRFQGAALRVNLRMLERVEEVAGRHEATLSQVALAWVLAQGDHIVPIFGTRRREHLEENVGAAAIQLDERDLRTLERMPPPAGARQAAGARY